MKFLTKRNLLAGAAALVIAGGSAVDGDDHNYVGVLIRNVSRRLTGGETDALRAALGPISKQLGRSSLRVKEKFHRSCNSPHF